MCHITSTLHVYDLALLSEGGELGKSPTVIVMIKTRSFPHPNQVIFVSYPNQAMSITLDSKK